MFNLKDKNGVLLFDYIYWHRYTPSVLGLCGFGVSKDPTTNLNNKVVSVLKMICGFREFNIIKELLMTELSTSHRYDDTSVWRQIPVYGTMFTKYIPRVKYIAMYEIFLLPPNMYDLCTSGWDMYDILYRIGYFPRTHTLQDIPLRKYKVETSVYTSIERFEQIGGHCQKSSNGYDSIYARTSSAPFVEGDCFRLTERGIRTSFSEDSNPPDSFNYWVDSSANLMNARTEVVSVNDAIDILTDFLSYLK